MPRPKPKRTSTNACIVKEYLRMFRNPTDVLVIERSELAEILIEFADHVKQRTITSYKRKHAKE